MTWLYRRQCVVKHAPWVGQTDDGIYDVTIARYQTLNSGHRCVRNDCKWFSFCILVFSFLIIFAMRCYASAAYAVVWCPCVRLSHSVRTNKQSSNFFHHTILVFIVYQISLQYFDRDPPPNLGIECRWVGTNRDRW